MAATLVVTCLILFTALRYPDLLSAPGSHVKYVSSSVTAAELRSIEQNFARLLQEKKPYLNPDLTLGELASMLGVQARHVSQLVNTHHGMNVAAYMNLLRTKEAARLLAEAPDKPIKVIMYESGFKSRSIFNQEFQRSFGVTPSAYRGSDPGSSGADRAHTVTGAKMPPDVG
jgi:AraC-like DNA-binding protein